MSVRLSELNRGADHRPLTNRTDLVLVDSQESLLLELSCAIQR